MNTTKILIVVGCILGLALAWIPAYASPTSKKVTITCTSTGPDTVTGYASVMLCDTPSCGNSVTCQPDPVVSCDTSANMISQTAVCSTGTALVPFKVGAVSIVIECSDNGDNSCGTSYTGIPISGGKAVSFPADNIANPDGDGVTVTVK